MSETLTRAPSVALIIEAVADEFDISRIQIKSPRRDVDAVLARHVCFWLARRLTELSFPQLGRLFGDRDHTTIMHGAKSIDRKIQGDAAFAERMNDLVDGLKNGMAAA